MTKRLLLAGAVLALVAGGVIGPAMNRAAAPKPQVFHFVTLDPIDVPIVGTDTIDGRLRVKLVLNTADASSADALRARAPELRAASIATLVEFSRLYASGRAPVNTERLGADLGTALKRQFPDVDRVLIVQILADA